MRILVLLHDAFGGQGGIAKFNRDLLAALDALPDVTEIVALPRYMPESPGDLPEKLVFDVRAVGGKLRYFSRCLRWFIRGGQFDLVISGHISLLPISLPWWLRRRSRRVLIAHGYEVWPGASNRLACFFASRVDRCIAVSEVTRERFSEWTGIDPNRISVLHNCVDLGRFTPGTEDPELRARHGLSGKRVFMTLGRLATTERLKGFDQVLEVMPDLVAVDPAIVYMIAGDGDDRDRLERKARSLGVDGNVVFSGYVPEEEKVAHYRMVDAYVMPSRGEGFGIVFLEALACGIPVVGSRLDGGREVLLDGRLGLVVDPEDRDELKSAILEALDQPKGAVAAELSQYSEAAFRDRARGIIASIGETIR